MHLSTNNALLRFTDYYLFRFKHNTFSYNYEYYTRSISSLFRNTAGLIQPRVYLWERLKYILLQRMSRKAQNNTSVLN
jgi:hypothetical protein